MENEFKLPGSSIDVVNQIIMAYGSIDKKVGLGDVAKRVATDKTTISRNVGFLLGLGILEGGRDKQITPKGKNLSNAIALKHDEKVRELLIDLFDENEFFEDIISAIKIRDGMDLSSLKSHIAYTAGKAGSSSSTGAQTVVDFLLLSGVVTDDSGIIKFVGTSPGVSKDSSEADVTVEASRPIASVTEPVFVKSATSGVALNVEIQISVNCSVDELPSLGESLRKILDDLKDSD